MIRWPWTNLQSLNLDWILRAVREAQEELSTFLTNVTTHSSASATTLAPGSQATVSVTQDYDNGFQFSFGLPQGADGADGRNGDSFKILDLVATVADLPLSPAQGDCYAVGDNTSNTCYIWNGYMWQNIGPYAQLNKVRKVMTPASGINISYFESIALTMSGDDLFAQVDFKPPFAMTGGDQICGYVWDSDIPYDSYYADFDTWKIPVIVYNIGGTFNRMSFVEVAVNSTSISFKVGTGESWETTKRFEFSQTIIG